MARGEIARKAPLKKRGGLRPWRKPPQWENGEAGYFRLLAKKAASLAKGITPVLS